MRTLKIITPSENRTTAAISEYAASIFRANAWEVQFIEVSLANDANQKNSRGGFSLSFSIDYQPSPGETAVFWLSGPFRDIANLERTQKKRFLERHTVFAADRASQSFLLEFLRDVHLLPLPPVSIRTLCPGPYLNAFVIEAQGRGTEHTTALVAEIARVAGKEIIHVHLRGLTPSQYTTIERKYDNTQLRLELIDDDTKLLAAMRQCCAYIACSLDQDLLESRAEVAAMLLKPLIIFGQIDYPLPDIFADKVSGYYLYSIKRFSTLIRLFTLRTIEIPRIGENALRLLFERHNPTHTLLEQYK